MPTLYWETTVRKHKTDQVTFLQSSYKCSLQEITSGHPYMGYLPEWTCHFSLIDLSFR
jgi:hypothetical protein